MDPHPSEAPGEGPGSAAGAPVALRAFVLLALVVPLFPAAALAQATEVVPAEEPHPDSVAALLGVVTKHGTLGPLSDAQVALVSLDRETEVHRRVTDPSGRFSFQPLLPGRYELRVRHLGFKNVHRQLRLEPGEPLQLEVAMALDVLAVEPMVVVSRREPALERTGFHDRRLQGLGHFLTADEIQRRGARRPSDLFRSIPGFRVHTEQGGARQQLAGRGGCEPTLYVNGGKTVSSRDIDVFLDIHELIGVEAYGGALAPARFPGERCGTIVAWTGDPQEGSASEGDRVGWIQAAAGVALSLWMVLRMS